MYGCSSYLNLKYYFVDDYIDTEGLAWIFALICAKTPWSITPFHVERRWLKEFLRLKIKLEIIKLNKLCRERNRWISLLGDIQYKTINNIQFDQFEVSNKLLKLQQLQNQIQLILLQFQNQYIQNNQDNNISSNSFISSNPSSNPSSNSFISPNINPLSTQSSIHLDSANHSSFSNSLGTIPLINPFGVGHGKFQTITVDSGTNKNLSSKIKDIWSFDLLKT